VLVLIAAGALWAAVTAVSGPAASAARGTDSRREELIAPRRAGSVQLLP